MRRSTLPLIVVTILCLLAVSGCDSDKGTNGPAVHSATFKVNNSTGTQIEFDLKQSAIVLLEDRIVSNGNTGTYQVQFDPSDGGMQLVYSSWEIMVHTDPFTGEQTEYAHWNAGKVLYQGTPSNGQAINLTARVI